MQDSEQSYPLHQPKHNGHDALSDEQLEPEIPVKSGPLQQEREPLHHPEHPLSPQLPHDRLKNALLIGVIAGILSALISIGITLANSSLYHTASATPAGKLTENIALALVGLQCLSFFVSLLISLAAGFIVGKIGVERRLGFLAGFLAGVLYYAIAVFLIRYIPAYPGNSAVSASPTNGGAGEVAGGIFVTLIFLFVVGIIGGLVSLLGAWIATRRHPYYAGYEE